MSKIFREVEVKVSPPSNNPGNMTSSVLEAVGFMTRQMIFRKKYKVNKVKLVLYVEDE